MAISEKLGYHETVLSAISTRLVALESAAELGCAAHALGIELGAWPADAELNVATYTQLLGRAVELAAAMMNGLACEACAAEDLDPGLHAMSGRMGLGIYVTVRGLVPGL